MLKGFEKEKNATYEKGDIKCMQTQFAIIQKVQTFGCFIKLDKEVLSTYFAFHGLRW